MGMMDERSVHFADWGNDARSQRADLAKGTERNRAPGGQS